MTNLTHLRRLRWAVRGTLAIGTAVSIAANILHADNNPISQAISAWPPLALLLAVDQISRIPATSRMRASVRITATAAIALFAAWISYWHMVGTVAMYGESNPHLWPLTVDGLMVVASVSLVELAIQIRDLTNDSRITHETPATPQPAEIVHAAEAMTAGAAAVVAPVSPAPAGTEMRPGAFGLMVEKSLPPTRRPVRETRVLTRNAD